MLAVLSTSVALAEDFKTRNGKEYKNAIVSRVEPDGIVVKTKSGLSKLYFTELPKEVQEQFHYAPAKATQFTNEAQSAVAQGNAEAADIKARQEALASLQKHRIQGYVTRKTYNDLIIKLFAEVSHNASDIPMGIQNPISTMTHEQKYVLLIGYPDQSNIAQDEYVDCVAYDSGPSSGASAYRSYTFYSR
jgi:hypothetical protein